MQLSGIEMSDTIFDDIFASAAAKDGFGDCCSIDTFMKVRYLQLDENNHLERAETDQL